MNSSIYEISLIDLSIAFVPVLPVIYCYYHWQLGAGKLGYGLFRMLAQLLVIGYFLTFIFESDSALVVVLILTVMLLASGWIALTEMGSRRMSLFGYAVTAILVGGGSTLVIITQGVVELDPWYQPRYLIPLAGMIFANAMNTVSLAAERLHAELDRDAAFEQARHQALRAGMIPVTNSLLAVGLVSLPGMMTGQILSGVSPLIAARYQIMVMCMIVASAGLSVSVFLLLLRPYYQRLIDLQASGRNDR